LNTRKTCTLSLCVETS